MKFPKSLTTVTPFSKLIALFLFVMLPFAGFYVGLKFQQASENSATNMVVPTIFPTGVQVTPIKSGGLVTITQDDNNKTIYANVGDTLLINLGDTQNWSVSIADPSNILRRSLLGIAERIGVQGRYVLGKPGTVVISATGTAKCAKGQMCPLYAILFKATVTAK